MMGGFKILKRLLFLAASVAFQPHVALSDGSRIIYADPFGAFLDGYSQGEARRSQNAKPQSPLQGRWKITSYCPEKASGKMNLKFVGNGVFLFKYTGSSGSIGHGQIVQNYDEMNFTMFFKNGEQVNGLLKVSQSGREMQGIDSAGCNIIAQR